MPGSSVSHLIFFVASILVATSVVAVIVATVDSYTEGIEDEGYYLSNKLKTNIEILNDPARMPYNDTTDTLIIYVKNTGMRRITMNTTVVLIDGLVRDITDMTILNGTAWSPGDIVQLTVDTNLANGDHRVKVIVEYGRSAAMDFRIQV